MTTIVYDHKRKHIACDSRETTGDEIKSDSAIKFRYYNGVIYFISGSCVDMDDFLSAPKKRGFKLEIEAQCSAIFVKDGKAFKCCYSPDIGYWEFELEYDDSIGSGGQWALSALDHGKTAKEAVEYAMTRDPFTGGEVHVFNLETMEFIDA